MTGMPSVNRAQAANAILQAACARGRDEYRAFLALTFPSWRLAKHHALIVQKLQDVADGKTKRLMLFLPPGSAKSTYANGRFVPWFLGRQEGLCAILATHTGDFAAKWGRRSRAIASSPAYRSVFGFGVSPSVKAADSWWLENGSEYMAVGVGGAVTGNRADLIVVDDPVKGREEADSQTMRNKTWDWYLEDLHTRLKPGGAIVLIMTRWHEDDLAGRLLADMQAGGEAWEVVSIPAECESADDPLGREIGQMLWPEWFRPEDFENVKRMPRTWSALYQQRPAPEEGAYFKRDWLQFYDKLPEHLRYYGASDYAVTADGGDWTVHALAGTDPEDNLYLVDLWRGQTDSLEWVEQFLAMLRIYQPQVWAEEAGVILKSMGPIINKRLAEERLYGTYRKQFTSAVDKPTRARSLQARLQMGKIFLPRPENCPWVSDLISELLTFPAGRHDDQVDAMALLCRLLDSMVPAEVPKPAVPLSGRVDAWAEAEARPTAKALFEQHFKSRRRGAEQ